MDPGSGSDTNRTRSNSSTTVFDKTGFCQGVLCGELFLYHASLLLRMENVERKSARV
jgi:hypothetical protein